MLAVNRQVDAQSIHLSAAVFAGCVNRQLFAKMLVRTAHKLTVCQLFLNRFQVVGKVNECRFKRLISTNH